VDPNGHTGVVVLVTRQSDGMEFSRVRISSGPRNGQTQWPSEGGWLPARDYEPRTAKFECRECGRDYWAPKSVGRCNDCAAIEACEDKQRMKDTGSRTFSRLGAAPRFTPAPEQANATAEQRERVDRGRVTDDSDSPF
jgi:hypothetical protein